MDDLPPKTQEKYDALTDFINSLVALNFDERQELIDLIDELVDSCVPVRP